MRTLRLALLASIGLFLATAAQAACPLPLTAKDASGTSQNFATENDANNNCVDDVSLAQAHTYNATLQSSAVASGNGTAFTVTGTGGAALTVNCSSCSGGTTVNFEGQEDGSNFRPIQASPSDGTAPATTTTTAGVTDWFVSTTGLQQIRARISGYSAGTVTVTAHAFAIPVTLPSQTVFQGGTWTVGLSAGSNTIGKFDLLGNAGAIMDFAGQNASSPANSLLTGCQFNTSPTTITNGNASPEQCDNAGDELVKVNVALPAGTNVIGKTGIDQTTPGTTNAIQEIPGTAGGASLCYLSSAASTNATNCKASAGQVYMYRPINTTGVTYYLRMYNLATAPTCSSSTGYVETIPVLPTGGIAAWQGVGEPFGTGIGFCLTGGGSSTDNTNAATGVYVALLYK